MRNMAIFAGRGRLPELLNLRFPDAWVVSFEGVGIDFAPPRAHVTCFEKSGGLLNFLKHEGVDQICFAGAITRPKLKLSRMDFSTLMMLPSIKRAIRKSDGHGLKIVRALVEARGFKVVAAHELMPEILADTGALGKIDFPDYPLGLAIETHKVMSDHDSGQALIMRPPALLGGMEDQAGTKALLLQATQSEGDGGYLFKASKIGQDLSMDMATIGIETLDQVKAARLDGIVLGAGVTQIIDKNRVIARADELDLFIYGVAL